MKLHRRFAHASSKKLKQLLVDAHVNDSELLQCLDEIDNKYDICKTYQRAKSGPVVGLLLAKSFNQT